MISTDRRPGRPRPFARVDAPVEAVQVSAYTIPTDQPESDGTAEWDATTIVLVEAHAGGATGLPHDSRKSPDRDSDSNSERIALTESDLRRFGRPG